MRININQFYVFYLVGLHKTISAAANKLGISKPAISMQIKSLEEWLGFSLFKRNKRSLLLNKQGQELYERISPMFEYVDDIETYVQSMLAMTKSNLRLGTHHLPGNYFIADLIVHAQTKYPNLKVDMELGTQDSLLEKLFQEQLDAVLIVGKPPKNSSCKTMLLFQEELALVCSSNNRLARIDSVTTENLNSIPIILQQQGTGARRSVLDFFEKHQITPNILLENLSSDVIKQFLHKMQAGSFINRFIVQKEIDDGSLHEIQVYGDTPTSDFRLAYLATQPMPARLKNFLEAIKDFTPKFLCKKDSSK